MRGSPQARFVPPDMCGKTVVWGALTIAVEGGCRTADQPRPTNGILVAITVINRTFASRGRLAMYTTARATC
jgi:hypothetical protein